MSHDGGGQGYNEGLAEVPTDLFLLTPCQVPPYPEVVSISEVDSVLQVSTELWLFDSLSTAVDLVICISFFSLVKLLVMLVWPSKLPGAPCTIGFSKLWFLIQLKCDLGHNFLFLF